MRYNNNNNMNLLMVFALFLFSGSRGFIMKYFAYVGNVTFTLLGTNSISRAFELLDNFGKATGFKQNCKKLKGLVCCKGGPQFVVMVMKNGGLILLKYSICLLVVKENFPEYFPEKIT